MFKFMTVRADQLNVAIASIECVAVFVMNFKDLGSQIPSAFFAFVFSCCQYVFALCVCAERFLQNYFLCSVSCGASGGAEGFVVGFGFMWISENFFPAEEAILFYAWGACLFSPVLCKFFGIVSSETLSATEFSLAAQYDANFFVTRFAANGFPPIPSVMSWQVNYRSLHYWVPSGPSDEAPSASASAEVRGLENVFRPCGVVGKVIEFGRSFLGEHAAAAAGTYLLAISVDDWIGSALETVVAYTARRAEALALYALALRKFLAALLADFGGWFLSEENALLCFVGQLYCDVSHGMLLHPVMCG